MDLNWKPHVPPHVRKWFESRVRDGSIANEVFTHTDPKDGTIRHFDATKLFNALVRSAATGKLLGQKCIVPIPPHIYDMLMTHRGIEEWKVDRLCYPYLQYPILCVEMPDGTHLTVDGHHRMVKLYRAGLREATGVMFPESIWKKYLVEFPKEIEDGIIKEYNL